MDRMYQNMLTAAKERLKRKEPHEIARNADIEYDENQKFFSVNSFGENIIIDYPGYECTGAIENWHHLLLLHYMDLADGTPLNDSLISFGSLKDGMVRGTKFDRTVENRLEKLLWDQSEETVLSALKSLGGIAKPSKADLSMEIPVLPRYPMTVNIWWADEEYPASGKILLDASADHYLTIEDAVTAGELVLTRLTNLIYNKEK